MSRLLFQKAASTHRHAPSAACRAHWLFALSQTLGVFVGSTVVLAFYYCLVRCSEGGLKLSNCHPGRGGTDGLPVSDGEDESGGECEEQDSDEADSVPPHQGARQKVPGWKDGEATGSVGGGGFFSKVGLCGPPGMARALRGRGGGCRRKPLVAAQEGATFDFRRAVCFPPFWPAFGAGAVWATAFFCSFVFSTGMDRVEKVVVSVGVHVVHEASRTRSADPRRVQAPQRILFSSLADRPTKRQDLS